MKIYEQLICNGKVHSTHTHAIRNTIKEAKTTLTRLANGWREINPNPIIRHSPLVLEVLIYEGVNDNGDYNKVVSRFSTIAKKQGA